MHTQFAVNTKFSRKFLIAFIETIIFFLDQAI